MVKSNKDNSTKKKQILLALVIVLALSIAGNITQLALQASLVDSNERNEVALQNYRNLQNQQLESLKQGCDKSRTDYLDSDGYMQAFRFILGKFSAHPQMLEQYIEDEALASCYAVAFVLRGYQDIYTFNEDRAFDFGKHVYIIDDKAFDEVKW